MLNAVPVLMLVTSILGPLLVVRFAPKMRPKAKRRRDPTPPWRKKSAVHRVVDGEHVGRHVGWRAQSTALRSKKMGPLVHLGLLLPPPAI